MNDGDKHRIETLTIPTPYVETPQINCYVLLGAEISIIDTGPKIGFSFTALEQGLQSIGLAFRDIRRIVVTHAHWDHYGLAKRIRYTLCG